MPLLMLFRQFLSRSLLVILLLFMSNSLAWSACVDYPAALLAMEQQEDVIVAADGAEVPITYRLAKSVELRAAGFQFVCPKTIATENILFVFKTEFMPAFHMRNVYAPLAIAFINKQGVIVDIQTMYPYVLGSLKNPRYRPALPAMYALEARQNFFAEAGLAVGSVLQSLATVE